MQKPIRLAACDPCRRLKWACDHTKPTCLRCVRAGRSNSCTYRERPFKKRRSARHNLLPTSPPADIDLLDTSALPASGLEQEPREHRYPNAGHQGLSSSANIFAHLSPYHDIAEASTQSPAFAQSTSPYPHSPSTNDHSSLLQELFKSINAEGVKSLIDFWLAKRATLSLGSLFVESCTRSLGLLLNGNLFATDNLTLVSQILTTNSTRPLNLTSSSSLHDLFDQTSGKNSRWESIAMALIVAGRATSDLHFFPPLYTCHIQQRNYQRMLADFSNRLLEVALSLDSLNEFQLICQYENYILRSVVDGDQSYNLWRLLGDVTSSLTFLGLNERIVDNPTTPTFFNDLRRSIFAQIYSDDKNMAVFLGRPPRLNRKFCCFQLPGTPTGETRTGNALQRPMADQEYTYFGPDNKPDNVTALCWTACCASLKEEILEAFQDHRLQVEGVTERFAAIFARAQSLWHSLPDQLRLVDTMGPCEDRSSLERDLLLNMRLTYLQTLFLTKIITVTQNNSASENEERIILQIAREMLALTVEAMVLKEHLVNSGTSLLWKVVHYGLPAAGIICLFMLRPLFWRIHARLLPVSKLIQDLSVFASEIQIGGLLQAGAPDYALIVRASTTIRSLLQATLSTDGPLFDSRRRENHDEQFVQQDLRANVSFAPLDLIPSSGFWGFEHEFWQDLADHSFLLATDM